MTAVFFSIINLPPAIRCDEDASLLVCVLSGPSEVATDHMHKITRFFAEELLLLYKGLEMNVFVPSTSKVERRFVRVRALDANSSTAQHVHLARFVLEMSLSQCAHPLCSDVYFSSVACSSQALLLQALFDLPAAQKFLATPGFSNKTNGCSKCWFARADADCMRRQYRARTRQEHAHHGEQWLAQDNKTNSNKYVSKYGFRYTPLLNLPYFDTIRMNMIDMMVRGRVCMCACSSLSR